MVRGLSIHLEIPFPFSKKKVEKYRQTVRETDNWADKEIGRKTTCELECSPFSSQTSAEFFIELNLKDVSIFCHQNSNFCQCACINQWRKNKLKSNLSGNPNILQTNSALFWLKWSWQTSIQWPFLWISIRPSHGPIPPTSRIGVVSVKCK